MDLASSICSVCDGAIGIRAAYRCQKQAHGARSRGRHCTRASRGLEQCEGRQAIHGSSQAPAPATAIRQAQVFPEVHLQAAPSSSILFFFTTCRERLDDNDRFRGKRSGSHLSTTARDWKDVLLKSLLLFQALQALRACSRFMGLLLSVLAPLMQFS